MRMPHSRLVWPSSSTRPTTRRFARSISSSRSISVSRQRDVAAVERLHGDAGHLLRPLAHLAESLEQDRVRREPFRQPGQLGDRRALVADPLEVEVRVEDREHEPEVARDRRLPREQQLDLVLDVEAAAGRSRRRRRSPRRPSSTSCETTASVAPRMERCTSCDSTSSDSSSCVELLVEGDARSAHPNRPVT